MSLLSASRAVQVHTSLASSGAALAVATFFCLALAERPDFVGLDALGVDTTHGGVVMRSTGLAGVYRRGGDGVDRHVHHPTDRAHGIALAEHRENLDALGEGELVGHAKHSTSPLLTSRHYFHFKVGPIAIGSASGTVSVPSSKLHNASIT